MEKDSSIEDQIEYILKELNISKVQLARILSVTESTVSRWSTGKTKPSPTELQILKSLVSLIEISHTDNDAKDSIETILGIIGKYNTNSKWPWMEGFYLLPFLGISGLVTLALYEVLKKNKDT